VQYEGDIGVGEAVLDEREEGPDEEPGDDFSVL